MYHAIKLEYYKILKPAFLTALPYLVSIILNL